MDTAMIDSLSDDLDDMAIRMLRLMSDYITVKLSLEELIKTGSLHLAKSRYIMGNKNVSILQLPSEESSEFTAATRVTRNTQETSEDQLSFELSKISLKDITDAGGEVKSRRAKEKNKSSEEEEEGTEKETSNNEIVILDPLKWFGVLVPQNMRQAQSNFSKAIEYSIQCANIQLEIQRLQKKYRTKLKEKNKLVKSS